MYSKNNNNNNSKPNQPGFPTVCHDLFAPQEFLSTNFFFFLARNNTQGPASRIYGISRNQHRTVPQDA